jgi:hypothetical protein
MRRARRRSTDHQLIPRLPVQHPGSAAKAALTDCPPAEGEGAHLAALVSCIPLFDGACEDARLRLAWLWDAKILADAPRCWANDLGMTWNRRRLSVGRIPVDGVAPTLAKQFTAMLGKMAEKVDPFYATGTARSSLRT